MRLFGAVLAGGRATRLGGVPKPLLEVGDRTMADRALDPLRPHAERLFVSTHQGALYAPLGLHTVEDGRPEKLGPLAGLAALARAIRQETDAPFWLLTVPGDTPFLPPDLAMRLLDGAAPGEVRVASFLGRWQPTVALWPGEALEGLPDWLEIPGRDLSIRRWIERHPHQPIAFPPVSQAPDGDPFFNVNTPEDLARARGCFEPGER
ncbi:molybdenum cofactor guanylyltransferase [Aureimonas sp. AU40]|uniref:molybdenum cofactor guanylyltransferase n=1 Tax=Aureimonas sp. AU40 TaxID=1637747 RepID=UPI000785CC10|nr:molybdenum cofactor guanylyltransferase [Aureimonas sp. AU40]